CEMKPEIRVLSTCTGPPFRSRPVVVPPKPLIATPRTVTAAGVAGPNTPNPNVADIRAGTPAQSMVNDRLSCTPPKSPASTQLMMPPGLVWLCARWNVRQGAARVHGLASLPVEATQERAFCAC